MAFDSAVPVEGIEEKSNVLIPDKAPQKRNPDNPLTHPGSNPVNQPNADLDKLPATKPNQ